LLALALAGSGKADESCRRDSRSAVIARTLRRRTGGGPRKSSRPCESKSLAPRPICARPWPAQASRPSRRSKGLPVTGNAAQCLRCREPCAPEQVVCLKQGPYSSRSSRCFARNFWLTVMLKLAAIWLARLVAC
jgi:hypothetical protein